MKTMLEGAKGLDPTFDFSNAYRRSYCTLLMVVIQEVEVKMTYTLDGKEKTLKDNRAKFGVFYKEYSPIKNSTRFFSLRNDTYFTTRSGAEGLIKEALSTGELEKLDDAGIEETFLRQVDTHR